MANPQAELNINTILTASATAGVVGCIALIINLKDTVTELRVKVDILGSQLQQITLINEKQSQDIRDVERKK